MTEAAAKRVRDKSMVVPWSANAPTGDDQDEEMDHHMDEPQDEEEKEMLPYCVMPWVERLLQVAKLAAANFMFLEHVQLSCGLSTRGWRLFCCSILWQACALTRLLFEHQLARIVNEQLPPGIAHESLWLRQGLRSCLLLERGKKRTVCLVYQHNEGPMLQIAERSQLGCTGSMPLHVVLRLLHLQA